MHPYRTICRTLNSSTLLPGTTHQRQLLPPVRLRGEGVEGGVVARLGLPLAVEIVGHDGDEVDPLAHGGDVVAALDGLGAGGDGHRQQEARQLLLLGLRLEGLSQFLFLGVNKRRDDKDKDKDKVAEWSLSRV